MENNITISQEHYASLLTENGTLKRRISDIEVKQKTEWVDSKEAARILRVTTRTVTNYRNRGILFFTEYGTKYLYKKADLKLGENYEKIN